MVSLQKLFIQKFVTVPSGPAIENSFIGLKSKASIDSTTGIRNTVPDCRMQTKFVDVCEAISGNNQMKPLSHNQSWYQAPKTQILTLLGDYTTVQPVALIFEA